MLVLCVFVFVYVACREGFKSNASAGAFVSGGSVPGALVAVGALLFPSARTHHRAACLRQRRCAVHHHLQQLRVAAACQRVFALLACCGLFVVALPWLASEGLAVTLPGLAVALPGLALAVKGLAVAFPGLALTVEGLALAALGCRTCRRRRGSRACCPRISHTGAARSPASRSSGSPSRSAPGLSSGNTPRGSL